MAMSGSQSREVRLSDERHNKATILISVKNP